MTRRQRVFYMGMITPDSYGRAVGEDTFAGAAEQKMISVARAMRHVGLRAIIVSLPFIGAHAKRSCYGPVVTSDDGSPVIFLATLRSKYLRKMLGAVFLAGFSWRHVRSDDTVILYNHAIEYFLALLLLRVRGVHVVQDIEDVPRPEGWGVREFLHHLGFALTFRLTSRRKMVVAEHVARRLGLNDYVVVRGVASLSAPAVHAAPCKWAALRDGKPLILHYGGTLRPDTGVELFCAAVEALAQDNRRLNRPVVFFVTGVGALGPVRALQAKINDTGNVRLYVEGRMGKSDYDILISGCHASLSLRKPGSKYSETTFPSKVIEVTSRGLALISSDQGDVLALFDDKSAFLLRTYEASELMEIIVSLAADPERVERVAAAGRQISIQTFSPEIVGKEMIRLL